MSLWRRKGVTVASKQRLRSAFYGAAAVTLCCAHLRKALLPPHGDRQRVQQGGFEAREHLQLGKAAALPLGSAQCQHLHLTTALAAVQHPTK